MSNEKPPYLVQFAHGVLTSPENPSTTFSDPLSSFNPLPDQLPQNPFAAQSGEPSVTDLDPLDDDDDDTDSAGGSDTDTDPASGPQNLTGDVIDAPEAPAATDAPVVETPVVETPVVETPVVETPVVETPVVETPVVETPVVETPVVDATDAPVVEEPVVDATDAPVVEEPVAESKTTKTTKAK